MATTGPKGQDGAELSQVFCMATRFAGFDCSVVHGCPVLSRRDDRFKTFRVVFAAQRPLDERMAARALLPALLQHGTVRYPDRPALARAREWLYGAWTGPAVGKHAESSILRLQAEAVAGSYLPGRPDQLQGALDLLQESVLEARALAPDFPSELFERERVQALAAARSVYDDKGRFAWQQAVAQACQGEPYAIPEHGGEAALAALQPAQPAATLGDFLRNGRLFCIAAGALPDDVPNTVARFLERLPANHAQPIAPAVVPARREPVRVRAHAPMLQAKVSAVLRVPVPASVTEHCALQSMLSLWGGGTHSRLFQEVREKRSLCYYASVGGDVRKGVVGLQSGCEAKNVDAVVQESMHQLDELRQGRFTEQELTTVTATITGSLRALDDSLAQQVSFTAEQWLQGQDQDLAGRIASYRAVTREQVVAAAQQVWLDHDYALLPEEGAS